MKIPVAWGVACAVYPGETEAGDRYLVRPTESGVLIAVIDGLGHGPNAARAATQAVGTLERHGERSLTHLIELCHQELADTRGVVLSAVVFDGKTREMSWLGVGNVGAILLRLRDGVFHPQSLLQRAGVVGAQLPTLAAGVTRVAPGDTLILATDGIRLDPRAVPAGNVSPQQCADRLLAEQRGGADDALVLVARYVGGTR